MNSNGLPALEKFIEECGTTILPHTSDAYPGLIGFKYTPNTVYAANWTTVSLCARGIAFDTITGKVVAHPFDKFFNYDEFKERDSRIHVILKDQSDEKFHPSILHKFRVMNKLDGSLGIAFHWNGGWHVKTAGSFDSPEAKWASNFLNTSEIHTERMNPAYTYCFEIIWLDAKFVHPLTRVYTKDDLVLIGVIRTDTGIELGTDAIKTEAAAINATLAEIYDFTDFSKVYDFATALPNDKEGVVVTFDTGFKLKIKGNEFLKLQKAFHKMSPELVIDAIKDGSVTIKASIPEEMPDLRAFAEQVEAAYTETYGICKSTAEHIRKTALPRKDGYLIAVKYGHLCQSILRMAYGGSVFFDRDFVKWAKAKYSQDGHI